MSKYLISATETYRVSNEDEAKQLIEESKNGIGELSKYSSQRKDIKSKGEIVESYYRVTLTKTFNNEKEPDTLVDINYETE